MTASSGAGAANVVAVKARRRYPREKRIVYVCFDGIRQPISGQQEIVYFVGFFCSR